MFIGCSGYPECRFVVHEEQETTEQQIVCPNVNMVNLLLDMDGKEKFYACNQYPKCKFTLAQKNPI